MPSPGDEAPGPSTPGPNKVLVGFNKPVQQPLAFTVAASEYPTGERAEDLGSRAEKHMVNAELGGLAAGLFLEVHHCGGVVRDIQAQLRRGE